MGISIIISLFIFNLVSAENFLTLPFYNQTTLLQGWFYNDGSIHKGIDYRCTIGDPLYAAADGLAMHSTQKLDSTYAYGNFVFINHENGFATLYAHLSKVNDAIKIYPEKQRGNTEYAEWTRIKRGDYIGDCGNTGTIVQHLHFEATKGLYGMDKIDSYDLYKVGKFYPYNESAEKMGTSSLWEFDPPKYLEQIETDPEPENTPTTPERSFWQRIIDFFTGDDNEDASTVGTSEVGNENEENSSANAQSEEENKPEQPTVSASYSLSFINSGKVMEVAPGEVINLQAQVKNTGTADWQRKNISANVVGGLVPNAVYHHNSWLTALRPTLLDKDLPAGSSGSFSFKINAPENPGEYIFQIQAVRVDNNFSNIPTGFWKVKIIVKSPTIVATEEQESRIQEKIQDLSERIGEEVGEAIEEIQKIVEKIFYYGGKRTPPEEDNNEEETSVPEISLLVPNTTILYTTSTSYNLSGNYNTSTYNILVNDLTDNNIFMISGTWTYNINLEVGTNTLYFVGWNEDLSVSSTELLVDIIREEEIVEEVFLPEITLDSSDSATIYTTSTSYNLNGRYNTSTYYILVNSTTTEDLFMNSGVWNYNVNLDMGTNTLHVVGWNEDFSTSSAELLVEIIREEEIIEEINLLAPIILNPTTSSVFYTTSSAITISGEKTSDIQSVFLDKDGEIITTTILTTTTWEINLNLVEGENDLIFYGTDNQNNLSPTSSILVMSDSVAPVVSLLEVEMGTSTASLNYLANDTGVGVSGYDVQFLFPPDPSFDPGADCEETILPSDDPMLLDTDQLNAQLEQNACTWFTTTTDQTNITFEFVPPLNEYWIFFRIRSFDSLGNYSEWQYSELQEFIMETATEGRVIINEIAWMGTLASANDEWIEICNVDEFDISLENWQLVWDYNIDTEQYDTVINLEPTLLPSWECTLLERTDQTTVSDYNYSQIYTGALGNDGEHLVLLSGLGNIMDEVDASVGWFAGDNETKDSMQRIGPTGVGNDANNWGNFSLVNQFAFVTKHDADSNEIIGSPGNEAVPSY